ncbi:MAG TPA: multiheme c-type cytochrome [Planctomycetota bacterium]|jgi:hypothetical protein|nr:multiheme c-type cytochrome [Planctomycetota bacterium]
MHTPLQHALLICATLAALGLLAAPDAPGDAPGGQTPQEEQRDSSSGPKTSSTPALLDGWQDLRCTECHAAQVEEWAGSAHAFAWESPAYQAGLPHLRRPARCHGCHAPEPLHLAQIGAKPRVRAEYRHLGVDCLACHLGPGETMLGPHGRSSEAHATARGASFKPGSNDLCIVCHRVTVGPVIGIAKGFVAEGPDGRQRSCVGCHMAFVERDPRPDKDGPVGPLDEGDERDEGDEEALPRPGRSHRLRGPGDPAFLAEAFAVTLIGKGDGAAISIVNQAAHRLPGLQEQSFVFHTTVLGEAGESLAEAEHTIDARSHIAAYGSAELPLPEARASVGNVRVQLTATHHPHGGGAPLQFLDMTLDLAGESGD